MLSRQLPHHRGIRYGMPETEFSVMTTACHFSTVPPLQIHTGLEGLIGVG